MAERLRRWTRNPLGSAREGSNPSGVGFVSSLRYCFFFFETNVYFFLAWLAWLEEAVLVHLGDVRVRRGVVGTHLF